MKIAMITASGVGARTNQDIPKQFLCVHDKPVFMYTLEAFQNHPQIDEICVVILPGWEALLNAYAKQFNVTKLKFVVNGGATGQESIYNGLKAIYEAHKGEKDAVVLIHDGVRPMVSEEIITKNLEVFEKHGNAVTSIPCAEVAMNSADKKQAVEVIDRECIQRTQTPQAFYLEEAMSAHEYAKEQGWTGITAMPALWSMLGKTVYFSEGSEKNLKITTVDDLDIFKSLLLSKRASWLK